MPLEQFAGVRSIFLSKECLYSRLLHPSVARSGCWFDPAAAYTGIITVLGHFFGNWGFVGLIGRSGAVLLC